MLGLAHLNCICEKPKTQINQAKERSEVWLLDSICELSHVMNFIFCDVTCKAACENYETWNTNGLQQYHNDMDIGVLIIFLV